MHQPNESLPDRTHLSQAPGLFNSATATSRTNSPFTASIIAMVRNPALAARQSTAFNAVCG